MKTSELKKDTVIVTDTPFGSEHAYLVDHVGREQISVTVVGGRRHGKKEWTAVAAIEQHISLEDGTFFVLAGPAIGKLVRAQAWALAGAPAQAQKPPMTVDYDYDADSNLPLGWSWGEEEWPGCDRILPTAMGPNGERIAKHGDNVYTAGFAYTSSSNALAARTAAMRACDALAAVRTAKSAGGHQAVPTKYARKWVDRLSKTNDAQAWMVEETIDALAKEAKASGTYELTGWVFGRDRRGCWYATSRSMRIVRNEDGSTGLSGPDDWDWEQKIMPILNRLATDPALNE